MLKGAKSYLYSGRDLGFRWSILLPALSQSIEFHSKISSSSSSSSLKGNYELKDLSCSLPFLCLWISLDCSLGTLEGHLFFFFNITLLIFYIK